MLSCADGGLAAVTPLPEAALAALLALQAAMARRLPHIAGLNPAAQRAPRERQGRVCQAPCAGTLADGPLLARFLEAPWSAQHALALAAGHTRAQLVAAAREAQASAGWLI
jgi:cleavage and polyadenylation specificity factor subunit 1